MHNCGRNKPFAVALPRIPRSNTVRSAAATLLTAALLNACGGGGGGGGSVSSAGQAPPASGGAGSSATPDFQQEDEALRQKYAASTIDLLGRVVDATGQPLAAVSITTGGSSVSSDSDGNFEFDNLPRRNLLLHVAMPGFYSEKIPVILRLPEATGILRLQDIILQARAFQTVRFAFGGDTSFGRRFMDPQNESAPNEIPPDNPDALIQSSDPEPGARNVLKYVKPIYQQADFAVVNFESPVTDNPGTPHPTKEYKFFSLPGAAKALTWAGIDYVSLGNNHLYDYLEEGTVDTVGHLDSLGIPHNGAGLNQDQALTPYYRPLNDNTFSFHSMTSIRGNQHAINYVATDTKGGAADLTQDQAVENTIQSALADSIPIAQLHGGTEYAYQPTSYIESAMRRVALDGAALVVGHHPHVAQGFGREGNTFLVHSLGNMAFDQARLETMLSFIAQVDMQADRVDQIKAVPIYLEDYRPRPIAGRLGDLLIRRISEFSQDDLLVYPFSGQGRLAALDTNYRVIEGATSIPVTIDQGGSAIVDLRQYLASNQYIDAVDTAGADLAVQTGRDLLMHGDFEDWDVDDDVGEVSRWKFSTTYSWVCMSGAYRGVQGMCNKRTDSNTSPSTILFRNTVRVMGDATDTPTKDLSFFGYFRADNAGAYRVVATYTTSIDGLEFGEEVLYSNAGGSHGWQPVQQAITMPDESQTLGPDGLPARGIRLAIRHEPPVEGSGLLSFDELALISWEAELPESGFERPHAREFLRVSGAPGEYQLTLHFRHLVPGS